VFDFLRVSKFKQQIQTLEAERRRLEDVVERVGGLDLLAVQAEIQKAREELELSKVRVENEKSLAESQISALKSELTAVGAEIAARKSEVVQLDHEILLQSFGLYQPRYAFASASKYKAELERVRTHQKSLVRDGNAATCPTSWTVNGSTREGTKMVRDFQKLILRAFNSECDANITDVKFNNVEAIEGRIRKGFDALNKLGRVMSIEISGLYLALKLDELHLAHEYERKRQAEKEEQKRERERLREEAKLAKEIEEARARTAKEEKHYERALANMQARLAGELSDAERELCTKELSAIQERLNELAEARKAIDYREANARAGYVYIISNIGSFGDQVFKIGMTRRLEPLDRIDELGDASVPFDFDVHALVFSDDAPSLESALHRAFERTRLNKVNLRREFFRASLEEIEAVIRTNFSKPVELRKTPEAEEFRESLLRSAVPVAGGRGPMVA
jgi:hypothetical protein